MFDIIVECGVRCVTIVSLILKLGLCAANLDIPLLTQESEAMSTNQEAGRSGWTMLIVLVLNPVCLIVIIAAGELTTAHTVKTSECLAVVSSLQSPFCILSLYLLAWISRRYCWQ